MIRIDIALCTFRRPAVQETLRSLQALERPENVKLRVIVADNDDTDSGRTAVEAARGALDLIYVHAPARNISIARNACLDRADGDWIAFLDDDEHAAPDWLAQLLRCAQDTGADAVFGPALAEYGADAPSWMRDQDHHSNHPVLRRGQVETGHTCNALLRWGEAAWRTERFDLARGTSGGEDTEFFFRLGRKGARFVSCETAYVYEKVDPARLKLGWLLRRKFRAGQSHAAQADGFAATLGLLATAGLKFAVCLIAVLICAVVPRHRNFWLLRGVMHLGVIAGGLSLAQPQIYGQG